MDNKDDIDDGTGNPLPFDPAIDYDDATFDGVGTYLVFRGLTGPSFRLTARSAVDNPAYINGFQVVGEPVPEPAGWGLLLATAAVGAWVKRRIV